MRGLGLISLLALAAASCSGQTGGLSPGTGTGGSGGYGRCSVDANCDQGGCVQGTCLPRPTFPLRPWAVEIIPSSNGGGAAFTEIVAAPTSGIWRLSADGYIGVSAKFEPFTPTPTTPGNGISLPGSANVVLEVPSLLPGRPTLTFESTFPSGGTVATLNVPSGLRSRTGTVALMPLAPADQSSPPYRFSAVVPADGSELNDGGGATGTPMTTFPLPPVNLIQGLLRDAFGAPKISYTARAYRDGTLISSASSTQADGKFQLSVPSTVSGEVVVELAPQSAADPWFIYNKTTLSGANQDLGAAMLPAYQVPTQSSPGMIFHVESDEAIPAFVGNAAVRALTVLTVDKNGPGVTRFWRNNTTNMAGDAELFLIPGMNQMARTYDVSVVPPPGSPYAATCVQKQVLAPSGATTIALSRRPRLAGKVLSALGAPVEGVTIVATRNPASARVCTATGPTTFTAHTDANGQYELYLDPDVYQVDYDPPAGSPTPRLTKPQVSVMVDVEQMVQLPPAALIEGDVVERTGGGAVPNASIRIFEPCAQAGCTDPAVLRAVTQTDLQGHFRAVVAVPGSN